MSQSILLEYIRLYHITLTHYYILKGIIQMTKNYTTKDVEEENNRVRKSQCHNPYSNQLYYII